MAEFRLRQVFLFDDMTRVKIDRNMFLGYDAVSEVAASEYVDVRHELLLLYQNKKQVKLSIFRVLAILNLNVDFNYELTFCFDSSDIL